MQKSVNEELPLLVKIPSPKQHTFNNDIESITIQRKAAKQQRHLKKCKGILQLADNKP